MDQNQKISSNSSSIAWFKIANLIESITEKLKVEEELLNLLYIQKSYLLQNMFI